MYKKWEAIFCYAKRKFVLKKTFDNNMNKDMDPRRGIS